jgi:hypothetical protein
MNIYQVKIESSSLCYNDWMTRVSDPSMPGCAQCTLTVAYNLIEIRCLLDSSLLWYLICNISNVYYYKGEFILCTMYLYSNNHTKKDMPVTTLCTLSPSLHELLPLYSSWGVASAERETTDSWTERLSNTLSRNPHTLYPEIHIHATNCL